MLAGPWKSVLMDVDRDTEFTGDDADQYSALVDLGADYEFVVVVIPTITSSVIGVSIQRNPGVSEVPVRMYTLDDDATGSFLHAHTAATTTQVIIFRIGAVQFLRIKADTNQAADRTFYVRGYNRS